MSGSGSTRRLGGMLGLPAVHACPSVGGAGCRPCAPLSDLPCSCLLRVLLLQASLRRLWTRLWGGGWTSSTARCACWSSPLLWTQTAG